MWGLLVFTGEKMWVFTREVMGGWYPLGRGCWYSNNVGLVGIHWGGNVGGWYSLGR